MDIARGVIFHQIDNYRRRGLSILQNPVCKLYVKCCHGWKKEKFAFSSVKVELKSDVGSQYICLNVLVCGAYLHSVAHLPSFSSALVMLPLIALSLTSSSFFFQVQHICPFAWLA